MTFTDFLKRIHINYEHKAERGERQNVYVPLNKTETWKEIKQAAGKAGVVSFICELWVELKKYFEEGK
jgi:hypothetical protein